MLEGIYGIIKLLHEAGFVAEMFDVRELLECDQDMVSFEWRLPYEKIIPLTGKPKTEDQVISTTADIPKEYYTGSSQYASAESEIESDDLVGIQQMALDPSGSNYMIDLAKRSKAESRSDAIRVTVNDTSAIQGQLLSNIHNAM